MKPPREGCIHVVIEIPRGSRNKYEIDHDTGRVFLDRRLFSATIYPADYGFLPDTLGEDGDPLDALVLLEDPTYPGVWVEARPVGVMWMQDEAGPDAKILCVPDHDERWDDLQDLSDLRRTHILDEIEHFFETYKALEDKTVDVIGWRERDQALDVLRTDRAAWERETGVGV